MVITIGGGYGSGGKQIARELSEILGYKLCDDDIIAEAVRDSDVDLEEETFRFYDESQGKAPLSELTRMSAVQRSFYLGTVDTLSFDVLPLDRSMAKAQREVFNKLADEGNCILLGRCADYYLSGREDTLRVFVINNEENCIERLMKRFPDLTEKEVKKLIQKTDKRREDYYAFFTGKRWGDIDNYDIILNCAKVGYTGAAEILAGAVKNMQKA